jgi:hypothetical protein
MGRTFMTARAYVTESSCLAMRRTGTWWMYRMDQIPWAVAAVVCQGASSPARSGHLEPPAWGHTEEAAVAVVAAGRAAGEEVVVVRDAIG